MCHHIQLYLHSKLADGKWEAEIIQAFRNILSVPSCFLISDICLPSGFKSIWKERRRCGVLKPLLQLQETELFLLQKAKNFNVLKFFFFFLESKGQLESNIFSPTNLVENRIGLIKDKIYPGEKDQVKLPRKLLNNRY